MESRFRRFLHPKRELSTANTIEEEGLQSVPYDEARPADTPPIFVYQSLGKSSREVRKNLMGNGFPLPSLPYENAAVGKPPVMGERPQKGNGPVKLQTSRRLSTGELMVTTQDEHRTIQDIREGDYVVGRKDRRLSQLSTNGHKTSVDNLRSSNLRTSCLISSAPSTSHGTSYPRSPPSKGLLRNSQASNHERNSARKSLGLTIPRSSMASQETWTPQSDSALDSFDGGNATLKALWKAEYGRLSKIYSQSRNSDIAKMDHGRWSVQNKSSLPQIASESTLMLDPLPKPSPDFIGVDSRRASATSTCSESHGEDNSDTSSHRPNSYTSSHGETTSQHARNSLEYDPVVAREDIRKMISQMRSAYISALDTQGSPPLKAKRTRKRRGPKLKPSPNISNLDPSTASPSSMDESVRHSLNNKWRNSRPNSAVGRLSPIQASPSKTTPDSDIRLQRADSTTLGNVLSKLESPSDDNRALRRRSRKSRASTPSRSPHSRKTHDTLDRPITPSPSSGPQSSWLLLDIDTAHAVDAMLDSPVGDAPSYSSLPPPQKRLFAPNQTASNSQDSNRPPSNSYHSFLTASADDLWPSSFKTEQGLGEGLGVKTEKLSQTTKSYRQSLQINTGMLPPRPPPPKGLPPAPPATLT